MFITFIYVFIWFFDRKRMKYGPLYLPVAVSSDPLTRGSFWWVKNTTILRKYPGVYLRVQVVYPTRKYTPG